VIKDELECYTCGALYLASLYMDMYPVDLWDLFSILGFKRNEFYALEKKIYTCSITIFSEVGGQLHLPTSFVHLAKILYAQGLSPTDIYNVPKSKIPRLTPGLVLFVLEFHNLIPPNGPRALAEKAINIRSEPETNYEELVTMIQSWPENVQNNTKFINLSIMQNNSNPQIPR
jgi:hypothetical protein